MATNHDEPTKPSTQPAHAGPHMQQRSGLTGAMIAGAVGLGVLLLLVGAFTGFAASRMVGHGDFDDRMGMASQRHSHFAMPAHMRLGTYGKVTSVSSTSLTLTDARTGGSVTFKIDSNTDVNDSKGDNAKVGDIKVGDNVSVRASSAQNDTADTIVINPARGY